MRVGRPIAVRPQPARVARELALALEIQEEIDRDGLTFRGAARRHGCSRMRICRLLALARLAPDIQQQVADLTTTTALEALTVEDLRWVAEALDWGEQRRRFAFVLLGPGSESPTSVGRTGWTPAPGAEDAVARPACIGDASSGPSAPLR